MKMFATRPAVLTLAIATAMNIAAQDKTLTRAQVPAQVLATADKETNGATIKGYATEVEHGKRVYEVETVVNGLTRDLQITADGTLTEIEEELPITSLPPAVSSALNARAKGAKIVKVESLTKGRKLVAYEASTIKNGHAGEIQVGPTGGSLSHEE